MRTLIKDSNGVHEISVEAAVSEKRIIQLNGTIDDAMANDFVARILYYAQQDKEKPVKVLITSGGGEIGAGMVIYDVIQSSPVPLLLFGVGKAYSMGAVLLACGEKGKRFLLPHSKMMIHEPLIPYGIGGKSSSIQTISDSLLKTKHEMEKILAKHTGKTVEEIAESTKTDHFFTAEEAIDFGLVDGVMEFNEMMEA